MNHKPNRIVSVTLPLEIYEKINKLAQDSYRTRAGHIRHIIRLHLRHLEENKELGDWWNIS